MMAFRDVGRLFVAALAAAAAFGGSAWADESYRTDYRVTLAGLPVARASFTTHISDRNYRIAGDISSAGLVNVFTSLTASTSVEGQMVGAEKLQPASYELVYTRGKRTRTYDVRFSGGSVVKTSIIPEPKRNAERWIPVAPGDLRSVFDPLGGLVLSENGGLCNRTIPIFDGESRMDLVLSPKGKAKFTAGDTSGEATVCNVRYVPKSGFNKGRSDIEYLRQAQDMEIWFAKAGGMKLYAPVYAKVPTRVGPLYITATRFGA
ncbi:DUF3108 domain-containing protein [Allorhizobium undicola]|uniref:DUF3108 domain-containing protein n=1 Tax=Allorhizobium undicola TaxID=78527 RepID=UPI003D34AE52